MKNKGQAAFEFLTTYGWAMLVVIITMGALAYFGVLNPAGVLPERCNFPSEFNCIDYSLTRSTGTVNIDLRHNYRHSIILVNSSCEFIDGTADSFIPSDPEWEIKETTTITCSAASGNVLIQGQKEKVYVSLTYRLRSGGYNHYAEGEVYANVK